MIVENLIEKLKNMPPDAPVACGDSVDDGVRSIGSPPVVIIQSSFQCREGEWATAPIGN
jgi:hypothetical protein